MRIGFKICLQKTHYGYKTHVPDTSFVGYILKGPLALNFLLQERTTFAMFIVHRHKQRGAAVSEDIRYRTAMGGWKPMGKL